MQKTRDSKRQIKILLPEDDHDLVRLAAALKRTTMAEFCRDVVRDETHRLTKNIKNLAGATKMRKGTA